MVQIYSFDLGLQWQRISDYVCISVNLLQLYHSQQNYTFQRIKFGSNMSSFEGATRLISQWFIFASKLWIALNGLQNKEFSKIFYIFGKILEISEECHNSKTFKIFKFYKKRADNFQFFFYTFRFFFFFQFYFCTFTVWLNHL